MVVIRFAVVNTYILYVTSNRVQRLNVHDLWEWLFCIITESAYNINIYIHILIILWMYVHCNVTIMFNGFYFSSTQLPRRFRAGLLVRLFVSMLGSMSSWVSWHISQKKNCMQYVWITIQYVCSSLECFCPRTFLPFVLQIKNYFHLGVYQRSFHSITLKPFCR